MPADLSAAATREGWNIFAADGDPNKPEIQRLDCQDDPDGAQLESDPDAWKIVRAGEGAHHIAARELICKLSPREFVMCFPR